MAICLSIYNSIDYHFEMDSKSELVPFSEKSSITREDNKIILTFEGALNYLKQALKNPEIYRNYGKYFAFAQLTAKINWYRATIPKITQDDLNEFKEQLVKKICMHLSRDTESNLKIDTLEKIIELSLKGLALDKKTGNLFLITSQNNKYCLTKINATNPEPTLNDWEANVFNLFLTEEDYNVHKGKELISNGRKFSMIFYFTDNPNIDFEVRFIWENKEEEINSFYRKENLIFGDNLDRKYLYLKNEEENQLYFSSHPNDTFPQLSEGLEREYHLNEFMVNKPTNGCCLIQNDVIISELFTKKTIKSANSYGKI